MVGFRNHIEMFRDYEEGVGELEEVLAKVRSQPANTALNRLSGAECRRVSGIVKRFCGLVPQARYERYCDPTFSSETFLCDVTDVSVVRPIVPTASVEDMFLVHYHRVDEQGHAIRNVTVKMRLGLFIKPWNQRASFWLYDSTHAFTARQLGHSAETLELASFLSRGVPVTCPDTSSLLTM